MKDKIIDILKKYAPKDDHFKAKCPVCGRGIDRSGVCHTCAPAKEIEALIQECIHLAGEAVNRYQITRKVLWELTRELDRPRHFYERERDALRWLEKDWLGDQEDA